DHVYTSNPSNPTDPATERGQIQRALQNDYAAFNYVFTQDPQAAQQLAQPTGGQYMTLYFNTGPAGGKSSGLNWRHQLLAGTAPETAEHVMASPDAVGVTLLQSAAPTNFGEREALKLAFADTGVTLHAAAAAHHALASAQALGDLPGLAVPNTLIKGDADFGDTFAVRALDVVGALTPDPTNS